MSREILKTDNTIDSRDLLRRIHELEEELERDPDDEVLGELKHLKDFEDSICGRLNDGIILINENHFEDYAKQLAEDSGSTPKDAKWPNNCIDWKRAAKELRSGLSMAEFDGVTYWYS